jgi:hypothetical protein
MLRRKPRAPDEPVHGQDPINELQLLPDRVETQR